MRVRAIGVFPLDSSSSISVIGGHVNADGAGCAGGRLVLLLHRQHALELIAATTRHDVSASDTALGHVDVGSVWALPPTLDPGYHFFPHERLSPYIGAGINATFFYGAHPAGAPVTQVPFSDNVGAAVQAGVDYNISGHWFANIDVKQIFLNTTASIDSGAIKAHTALNPLVVGMGIGYWF